MRTAPLRMFVSYAHEDESFRIELGKWLQALEREKLLIVWHDRQILAGQEWADVIDRNLSSADLVLLLISPDFVASTYCFHVEMAGALDRHNRGLAMTVPIFVRPTDFSAMPFAKLQGLPRDAIAISTWRKPADAFKRIAKELRESAKHWAKRKTNTDSRINEPARHVQRDTERMQVYYQAFARPAFSIPCIFEGSLNDLATALRSLTEALATGTVTNRDKTFEYKLAPIAEFSTKTFRAALQQIMILLARTQANVKALINELGIRPDETLHLEFLLKRLAPSYDRIDAAVMAMGEIDAQRNAIIRILNYLLELSNIAPLATITSSPDLLRASRAMDALGIGGSWDLYYLREASSILDRGETPNYESQEMTRKAQIAKVQPEDYQLLAQHIEKQVAGGAFLADAARRETFDSIAAKIRSGALPQSV